MPNNDECAKLVKQAQLGDKGAFNCLAEAARERLRTDFYRLTLDYDLTQEIVQESLLEMLKILRDLKEPDKFWPWLYKIALNKLRLQHRRRNRRKTVPLSDVADGNLPGQSQDVMADALSQELKQIVLGAMRRLKPRHRAVLTMRCYREMEYSAIADVMGCSEFAAKMLFYRAKKTLKKQLARDGFGKSSLLMALVVFGKLTAPTKAAAAQVTISTATIEVGAAATLAGAVTSKPVVVSAAAAGVLAISTLVVPRKVDDAITSMPQKPVKVVQNIPPEVTKANEESWYFYPPKSNGAVVMRLMEAAPGGQYFYCKHLQNEEASYEYDRGKNVIYINNYRHWHKDLSVWRLPTDSSRLQGFVSGIEGTGRQTEYIPDLREGLMVVTRTLEGQSNLWTTMHYNVLNEEYFRYNWPEDTQVVDNRDPMHRRGWTYFQVSGKISGKPVSGFGQLPFVLSASMSRPAWLKLNIGSIRIEDSSEEARIYDSKDYVKARYKGGSFFKGLARPWMGLHTIDTIRRDAADRQIVFKSTLIPQSGKAEVELTSGRSKLIYLIDMEKDLIEHITFQSGEGITGELEFSYLQKVDGMEERFNPPRMRTYLRSERASFGVQWLVQLAEGGSLID